jgi:hypothetical protein
MHFSKPRRFSRTLPVSLSVDMLMDLSSQQGMLGAIYCPTTPFIPGTAKNEMSAGRQKE